MQSSIAYLCLFKWSIHYAMRDIGKHLRIAIVELLEGKLSESDKPKFVTWVEESRVAKYYFETLLSLESIITDLKYLSEKWKEPMETDALNVLTFISKAQVINAQLEEEFMEHRTYLQLRDEKMGADFVGHGDADFYALV